MNEPVSAIKNESQKLKNGTVKNANTVLTSNPTRKLFNKPSEIPKEEKGTSKVFYHVMSSHTPVRTKYGALTKIRKGDGTIRIYNPKENVGWRNANPVERIIYNTYIQYEIYKITLKYENSGSGIYGIITFDGSFHIRDKTKEKEGAISNLKMSHDGRSCTSFERHPLRDYMWNLGIRKKPENYKEPKKLSKLSEEEKYKVMTKVIKANKTFGGINMKKWSPERIEFYYAWSSENYPTTDFCDLLMQKMDFDKLLLKWRKY